GIACEPVTEHGVTERPFHLAADVSGRVVTPRSTPGGSLSGDQAAAVAGVWAAGPQGVRGDLGPAVPRQSACGGVLMLWSWSWVSVMINREPVQPSGTVDAGLPSPSTSSGSSPRM